MRFDIQADVLSARLAVVAKAIKKSPIPIFNDFLFECSNNVLSVTASNNEVRLTTRITIEGDCEGGSCVVPSKLMLETFKGLGDERVTFQVNEYNNGIVLSKNGEYRFVCTASADEFPNIRSEWRNDTQTFTVHPHRLIDGLSDVTPFVAVGELRPVLSCALMKVEPLQTTFVGTDGIRLCKYMYDSDTVGNAEILIRAEVGQLLPTVLAKCSDKVTVTFDGGQVHFETDEYQLVALLVEGKYPDYNAIIPNDSPTPCVFDRMQLLGALRRTKPFVDEYNTVRLTLNGGVLTVRVDDYNFSKNAEEEVHYSGGEWEGAIGMSLDHLIDALSVLNCKTVAVHIFGDRLPVLIRPQGERDASVTVLMSPKLLNN